MGLSTLSPNPIKISEAIDGPYNSLVYLAPIARGEFSEESAVTLFRISSHTAASVPSVTHGVGKILQDECLPRSYGLQEAKLNFQPECNYPLGLGEERVSACRAD